MPHIINITGEDNLPQSALSRNTNYLPPPIFDTTSQQYKPQLAYETNQSPKSHISQVMQMVDNDTVNGSEKTTIHQLSKNVIN